LFMC